MNKTLLLMACLATLGSPALHAGPESFLPIGAVTKVERLETGVALSCADGSSVRIAVLAPDLIRVRAAFRQALPGSDHSWAVDRTQWPAAEWTFKETEQEVQVVTGELEVHIHRSPLLVEFRDARTRQVINSDRHPMGFDPKTGAVGATKTLGLDEHFYGLGEKAARLDKRRGHFAMWNSDTPAYTEGTDPVYQTIPFYMGWQNGQAYGVLFDNSYRTHFDFGSSTQESASFWSESGELNYYFFWGPSMKKILGRYADLTGHMPMPPLWALGNQQSRWSYYPDTLAEEIVRRYRADDLPLDVLHLDIDYMNGYRDFTWNSERFPDPKAFTARLRALGVKVVTIVDPGVKYEPEDAQYSVFNEGRDRGFFLKRANGDLYVGEVWPGKAVFVDYTLADAAKWWGDLHRAQLDAGVSGIWDDMNEPSDFVDKSGVSQQDVVSYDEGSRSLYAKNRNVFALGMVRATYEGLRRLRPDLRPYIITRAAYAGVQRYSTMWTGDSPSTWESLALSIPMFETLGLSGEPFVGGDIPGFIGRADGELLARWYEVGFLAPFCRNHACIDAYDHEPWRFGTYYEDIVRKYLKLRYELMPFLYATLEEAHRTGVPLFRPLLLNYPSDANTLDIDDEFMIGGELLAAPVVKSGQTSRMVYLPEGVWYDFWTGNAVPGGSMIRVNAPLDVVPLFVRGGSILPLAPAMNFIGEKPWDPLRFAIYPDGKGTASASLYEDDGVSPAAEQGVYRRTRLSYTQSAGVKRVSLSEPEGSFVPAPRDFVFSLGINPAASTRVHDDGKPRDVLLK